MASTTPSPPSGGWVGFWCLVGASAKAEGCVPGKVSREDVPRRCELLADESHPHQPSPHREFRILVLGFFRAGGLDVLRHLGKGEAKLDVAFQFSAVQTALALRRGVGELEKPEFNRAFREGRMVIEAMVSRLVVMLIPSVVGVVSFVPNVRQPLHRLGLFLVEPSEEVFVYRLAVASDAALVNPHGGNQEAFVACHQVGKVAEGLRRVVGFADVDVDSAHMVGVAFRSLVPQPPEEFLQGFDVGVGQNRRDQFGLFAVAPCLDAHVPLEFPLAAFAVPCAVGVVPVAACRVLAASRPEEVGGNLGCLVAADVVHLDFHPDGLVLHALNLPCGVLFHFRLPLSLYPLRRLARRVLSLLY